MRGRASHNRRGVAFRFRSSRACRRLKPFADKAFGKTRRPGTRRCQCRCATLRHDNPTPGSFASNGLKPSQSGGVASFRTPYPEQVSVAPTSVGSCKRGMQRPSDRARHDLSPITSHLSRPHITAASQAPAPRRSPLRVVPEPGSRAKISGAPGRYP